MPSQIFNSKRHDDGISPIIDLTPPVGLVDWDLEEPGMTVKLIARLPTSGSVPKMDAPAVVVGPWSVRYDPEPTDVDLIGTFDVEVEATRSNGKKITLPTIGYLQWTIGPDLDDA